MVKPIREKRKAIVSSKKRVGPRATVSHGGGRQLHDKPSKAGRGAASYITQILKIPKAVSSYTRQAVNRVVFHKGESGAGNGRNQKKVRPLTRRELRTQTLHLVIAVLRKADISSRFVLGAKRFRGHWWIEFVDGWIRMTQLLKHKTLFSRQHPKLNPKPNLNQKLNRKK